MPFRVVGMVALGVVLGFLLGGIAPRVQLAERDRELSALKKRLERFDRPNLLREFFPALGQAGDAAPLRAADEADGARAAARSREAPAESVDETGQGSAPTADEPRVEVRSAGSSTALVVDKSPRPTAGAAASEADARDDARAADGEEDDDAPRRSRELTLSNFDKLIAVQRLRAAQSRSALIDQADLSEQEVAQLDRSVSKMNGELAGYGEELLQHATGDDLPSASQMLGLGHDVSGIMLEGQQNIDKVLGPRGQGVDREAKEIWNYIDLGPMRAAAEQMLPKAEATDGPDDPGGP